MSAWSLALSIIATLISVLGWILRPVITKWVYSDIEKNRAIHKSILTLNTLKEKWLDYFRSAISEYIGACEVFLAARVQKSKVSTYSINSLDPNTSANIHISLDASAANAFAKTEEVKTKIVLLFKSSSPHLNHLESLLVKCREAADNLNTKELENAKTVLKKKAEEILAERWAVIKNEIKITDITW